MVLGTDSKMYPSGAVMVCYRRVLSGELAVDEVQKILGEKLGLEYES